MTTEYIYDEMNRVVSQRTTGKTEIAFQYTYDANGYITGEVRTEGEETYTRRYEYDAVGQLTAFAENGYSERYTYDAAGNMTEKTADGVKTQMAYNAANQLTSLAGAGGTISYEYDANGNLVRKELGGRETTYTYNAMGKLASYLGYDGYAEQYTYDAAGNCVEKQSKGASNRLTLEELAELGEEMGAELTQPESPDEWTVTEYVNDVTAENTLVLMEKIYVQGQENDASLTYYEYGIGRVSMYAKEGLSERKTDYVYDGRGSVAQEVSYNNAWYNYWFPFTQDTQVKSQRYTPFGSPLTEKETGYGYNGEYYSAQTGAQFLQMRYYEPDMMRFSQKDMIQMQGVGSAAMNRYAYAANNPVNFADPSGLFFKEIGNFFSNVGKGIVNGLKTVGNAIVSGAKAVGSAIVNGVKTIGNALYNGAKYVGNAIVSGIKTVGNALYNGAKAVGNAIVGGIKTLANGVKSTTKALIEYQQAVVRQYRTNIVKSVFPSNDVAEENGKIGIRYNGKFVEIISPEQAMVIKACMDALEFERRKNEGKEKLQAAIIQYGESLNADYNGDGNISLKEAVRAHVASNTNDGYFFIGVEGEGTVAAISGSAGIQLAFDQQGNVVLQGTVSAGIGAGASGNASIVFGGGNGNAINSQGESIDIGGGGGYIVRGGYEQSISYKDDGTVDTSGWSGNVGFGTGIEGHITNSYTYNITSFNFTDIPAIGGTYDWIEKNFLNDN